MKRFFSAATARQDSAGTYSIALDGKPVRTPSGSALALPTQALATAIADEWAQTGETIRPSDLPLTQLANTALDRTSPDPKVVIDAICAYCETDLLCYRADAPASLVAEQAKHWDGPLAWFNDHFGAGLTTTTSVFGHHQPDGAAQGANTALTEIDAFALTALHQITVLTGSMVLALAFAHGIETAETIWQAATVDDRYQQTRWGEDAEAAEALEKKRLDFLAATTFWTNLSPDI